MKPVVISKDQFLKARFARDEALFHDFLRRLVGSLKEDRQQRQGASVRRNRGNSKGRAA